MGGNYLGGLFKPHYHAFSNKKRFIQYIDQVFPESQLLLSTIFDEDFIRDYTDRPFEWLVHLNRISSQFDVVDGVVTSTCRTISMLLVAIAIVMGAKRIFIAGMDGYKSKEAFISNKVHFYEEAAESNREAKDFRTYLELHDWNDLMLQKINEYLSARNKEGVHIITPTNHKQFYSSRYILKA
jgi:4-hydroxy 2-oxovalerate aldolase